MVNFRKKINKDQGTKCDQIWDKLQTLEESTSEGMAVEMNSKKRK